MITLSKTMSIVAIAALIATLIVSYLYIRFPLSVGNGINYYTNYLFVYQRMPQSSSFIFGPGPDIMPFTRDSIVWGASPFSFEFVGDFSPDRRLGNTSHHIYRDKSHVIYKGEVVWDSDPESLQLFKGYAKDKKHVYMHGYVSKRLDPETFELLGCHFWKDKNGVYNWNKGFENSIAEIDLETFELREPLDCSSTAPYTAKDKNHLYKSDASGFRIIK